MTDKTLKERLREWKGSTMTVAIAAQEAADALDAQEARIKALEGALREVEVELPILRDEGAEMRDCLRAFDAAWDLRDDLEHEVAMGDAIDRARALLGNK